MGGVPPPFAIVHRLPADPRCVAALAAAGAGGFELDVQLRGDAVVVSHYLPFLQLPGWLEHDGARFRWGGGPPRDRTLAEALAQLPDGVLVTLDPKEQRPARRQRLAATIAACPGAPDARLIVTTGDARDLAAYRSAGLRTWRTAGSAHALAAVLAAGRLADDGIAVRHELLDRDLVRRLGKIAPQVTAWTVNDAARAMELVRWGVTAVTTDEPEVIAAVSGR
jgi:glycerophosphoryl diester phosphodiesterase